MFKIEKFKEYEIKLMPNYFDIPKSIFTINKTYDNGKIYQIYLSYFLNEKGEIDIIKLNKMLINFIDLSRQGFYGTSEGYFLNISYISLYYANSNKSEIYFDKPCRDENVEKFQKYTDIVYYEPINLIDLKCEYNLAFKTSDEQGFMKIYNIGIKKTTPFYKDDDDKNKIISLYDGVYQLKDYDKYILNEERKAKIKEIIS
jgi:hypothetical protein